MNRRAIGTLLALLLVAGCAPAAQDNDEAAPPGAEPFGPCAPLTAPPPATASASAGPDGEARGGDTLPEVELPCFHDGTPVRADAIRGPAVVNLWASYCEPCRVELPAFQRLAERAGDRLHVVGIDTRDGRSAARSIGEDFALTFPTLYDREAAFQQRLGRGAFLPMTLFVDAAGRIQHVDASGALDDAALTELVAQHLDVAVEP